MYVDLQQFSIFGINMCRSKHSGGEMHNSCSFKFCHVYKDHPNMGTAIKHPVKPSFVIFDIRAL